MKIFFKNSLWAEFSSKNKIKGIKIFGKSYIFQKKKKKEKKNKKKNKDNNINNENLGSAKKGWS